MSYPSPPPFSPSKRPRLRSSSDVDCKLNKMRGRERAGFPFSFLDLLPEKGKARGTKTKSFGPVSIRETNISEPGEPVILRLPRG